MRHIAGFALTLASIMLAIVAILIGAPALFYITTALIATIAACHLQAYLAVRGLTVDRVAPKSVRVGDLVTIEITIRSLHRIRRTLVTVSDNIPGALAMAHRSPSLPVAPAYDFPVRTQYQLRASKRGLYRWSGITLIGTDALGLVTKTRAYETAQAEMVVLPQPIPISVDLPSAAGWGVNESESGQARGAGIEPRGIRQYRYGDSVRHIHWPSSARTGQLLVKEFEAGTQAAAVFCIQRGRGTEVGKGAATSLEQMCGNAAFLAETFLRQGVRVYLAGLDERASHHAPHERITEIYHSLAMVDAGDNRLVADDLAVAMSVAPPGSIIYLLVVIRENSLPGAISKATRMGLNVVAVLYDALAFKAGRSSNIRAATETAVVPEFIAELRAAGAQPFVVPLDIGVMEGKG